MTWVGNSILVTHNRTKVLFISNWGFLVVSFLARILVLDRLYGFLLSHPCLRRNDGAMNILETSKSC